MEQKIEKTVLDILKDADMDEMTMCKLRNLASDKLGINLSVPEYKQVVRGVVDSFLSNRQEEAADEVEGAEEAEGKDEGEGKQTPGSGEIEVDDNGDLIICRLSKRRRLSVQEFNGMTLVSIREYIQKDGKELPTSKGISLTIEQWRTLSNSVLAVEKAIQKIEKGGGSSI